MGKIQGEITELNKLLKQEKEQYNSLKKKFRCVCDSVAEKNQIIEDRTKDIIHYTKALEESENKIKKLICCGNCINQKCSKNFDWNYIAKDRNEMINIDKCTSEEYKFWIGG